jgi:hypothetical protein
MSGLVGGGKKSAPDPKVSEAQARQEGRAEAQEASEMKTAQARRRLLRTGGLRLLFSPVRLEGPGTYPKQQTTLGIE